MKKSILLVATVALAFISSAQAQLKVGTVDMNRVFSSYYKTKDAETKINEARATAKTELDTRMEAYQKSLEDINKLNQEIQRPELSDEVKSQKARTRDEKIAEAKGLEREINEFRATREKQLQEQAVRMRNGIVEEITEIVQGIVSKKGLDMVFDSSGSSLNGVPILLHSQESYDFSDEVIAQLNEKAPAGE